MTGDQLVAMLKQRMADRGINQKQLAAQLGVSTAYLSDVLKGKSAPGGSLLQPLGLRRVITYEPTNKENQS